MGKIVIIGTSPIVSFHIKALREAGLEPVAIASSNLNSTNVENFAKTLPMKRLGKPQEIGDFVKSIVENNIKYLSGAVINFDGANSNFIY